MMELEKSIRINKLFDVYGNLLTEKQQNLVELYYGFDLSLGEIASQMKISRNAVYDALKKAVKALEDYEMKLRFLEKTEQITASLEALKKTTDLDADIEKIKERL